MSRIPVTGCLPTEPPPRLFETLSMLIQKWLPGKGMIKGHPSMCPRRVSGGGLMGENLQTYQNLSGESGVRAYEIGDDFIKVEFSNGTYLYTYQSAGE